MFGCEPQTTNNKMELRAVIEGLKALNQRCEVIVRTDSQYVQRGVTEWLQQWKARGWTKKKSKNGSREVLNQELWVELDGLLAKQSVNWTWVKGHADDQDNIRCDRLANWAAREQLTSGGIKRL
jgi:ribonuclease HI